MAVDVEQCWELIESVRVGVPSSWEEMDWALGDAMVDRLAELPVEEVIAFELVFSELRDKVATDRSWKAAIIIQEGCGDDGFTDFCAAIVGLGRVWYERVLADPDNLAGHPAVQSIAAGEVSCYALRMETVQYCASEAYARITGDQDRFWCDLEAAENRNPAAQTPYASPANANDLRLPRLAAMFPETVASWRSFHRWFEVDGPAAELA